jgi:hypothetical protein
VVVAVGIDEVQLSVTIVIKRVICRENVLKGGLIVAPAEVVPAEGTMIMMIKHSSTKEDSININHHTLFYVYI